LARSFSKRISGTTPYYNLIRRVAFPSTRTIVIATLVLATFGIGLSFSFAERTVTVFLNGAVWGIVAFMLPAFVSDVVLYFTIMKDDPLFYLRRCLALSLFTTATWVVVFLFSSFIAVLDRRFSFPDFALILGLFAVVPPRGLTVFSMSRSSIAKRALFTLMEPTLTVLVVIAVFGLALARMATGLILASVVGLTFAFALITIVEVYGRSSIGFSPIRMFRAFLTDWLENENQEIESYLNELGVEAEIEATALAFRKKGSDNLKGVIFVSNLHPGPFLNVGSSVLPYLMYSMINRKFNAITLVPHGVSGHELNLVSQEQNERIIRWVLKGLEDTHYDGGASQVTRMSGEIATATSQVFDGCALVTMTTSPSDMEDVPSEVFNRLSGLTQGRFRNLALIDAHNCLTAPTTMTSRKIGALEEAALASLQVTAEEPVGPFMVGVARRVPTEFALKKGFGPVGITVMGIEASGQRFAYVNVDGNNMVGGLREKIVSVIKSVGFDDGEVMTSDTHMVNGIVSAPLGYYRVGEAVPTGVVLTEVTEVCREALADLEICEVGTVSGQIPVTTLGSKSLRRVMRVVYRVSKLTALTLFPIIIAITILSLLFLV
jgi:putative membrane protein